MKSSGSNCLSGVDPNLWMSAARLTPHSSQVSRFTCLNLHRLQVFVDRVFVTMILHLVQVTRSWSEHWVNLHDPMADGAVLPVAQHHEADDNDCGNGHCNGQQTHEGAAVQTEVLSQGPHRFRPPPRDLWLSRHWESFPSYPGSCQWPYFHPLSSYLINLSLAPDSTLGIWRKKNDLRSIGKEIIQSRAESSVIEIRKTILEINETNLILWKDKIFSKSLTRLIKLDRKITDL